MLTRAKSYLAVAACAAAVSGLALSAPASAAAFPNCSTAFHCTTNILTSPNVNENGTEGGTAGYYGADDNHTHYRYVQTVTKVEPQLLFALNDTKNVAVAAVGARLCDPTTGYSAETGAVAQTATSFGIFFASGYSADGSDPCVHDGPLVKDPIIGTNCGLGISNNHSNVPGVDTCGEVNLPGVSTGDTVALMVFYVPWAQSHNFRRISFGACDLTTGVCRQAYSNEHTAQFFWEFGIGAFTPRNTSTFTAPANNLMDTFWSNAVTCYGCAGMVPITSVQPVNQFGIGGLWEAQLINTTSQVTFSANDSLNVPAFDAFNVSNGSSSGP